MSDIGNPGHRGFTNEAHSSAELKAKAHPSYLRLPRVPIEWYGSNSWRLPSGKALAEFALQAGFLAPLLFKTEGFPKSGLPGLGTGASSPSRSFKKARPA